MRVVFICVPESVDGEVVCNKFSIILTQRRDFTHEPGGNLCLQQTVCGFDLLRAHGKSYVCDVNGFSFVKNSMKYYDDCAKVLGWVLSQRRPVGCVMLSARHLTNACCRNIIMRDLAPQFLIPWSIPTDAEDIPIVPTTSGTMWVAGFVFAQNPVACARQMTKARVWLLWAWSSERARGRWPHLDFEIWHISNTCLVKKGCFLFIDRKKLYSPFSPPGKIFLATSGRTH